MSPTEKRDAFVQEVLHGGDRRLGASLLRGLLLPASYLHRIGLELYLLTYRLGMRTRYQLMNPGERRVPTIAIGNLTSGGTGKTPMAQLVAGGLHRAGHRVVLLSRGHGGSGEAGDRPRIVSDGFRTLLGVQKAGDEPVLLADSLPGIPVLIGRDRRQSGDLAIERFATDVVVLDDGLQYWQLERDLDIVLLDARRPFDNGFLLPRGLLREPPSHLARAKIVVLTRADRVSADDLRRKSERVARLAPHAAVFTATHAPLGWVRAGGDRSVVLPLDSFAGRPVRLFAGIADNDGFRASVEALGVTVADTHFFADHHPYTRDDAAMLAADTEPASVGSDANTGAIAVTTEKDLVKVASLWPKRSMALYALRIGMKIDDESRFFKVIEDEIA